MKWVAHKIISSASLQTLKYKLEAYPLGSSWVAVGQESLRGSNLKCLWLYDCRESFLFSWTQAFMSCLFCAWHYWGSRTARLCTRRCAVRFEGQCQARRKQLEGRSFQNIISCLNVQYSGSANGEITVWCFTVVEGFIEEQAFEKGP